MQQLHNAGYTAIKNNASSEAPLHTGSLPDDPVARPAAPVRKARRLLSIGWVFAAVVVCLLALAWYSIGLLSAGRAYVAGEGLWSKAQKDALHSLQRYARLRLPEDYDRYRVAAAVILGDRRARLELEKPDPDYRIAYEGFLAGRNEPDDIEGMIRLFRNYRGLEHIDHAIALWTRADREIDRMTAIADRIHADIQSGVLDTGAVEQYVRVLDEIDRIITPLEVQFSYTLGVALRRMQWLLLAAMSAAAALMLAAAFAYTRRMVQRNEQAQAALHESESQLRSLLQFAPLPILISRMTDHVVVYANDRALAQFRLSQASVGTQRSSDFYVRPDDRTQLLSTLERDGSVRDLELQLKDAHGRPFWVLLSTRRILHMGNACLLTALNNIDERKRAQDDLKHRAFHDELTGLPNRAMFMDSLGRALARAQRRNGLFSVLFIDLDRFKIVNDTLGHDAGDRLLQMVASRIRNSVREGDLVARLGGDEFVVLIEQHDDAAEAARVARKLLDAMERDYGLGDREVVLTASVGISIYPQDGLDVNALVKNADIAMYQAKELGRNNFQFYTASQNQLTLKRLDLEMRLKRAMEQDEFVLRYQPIIDLRSRRMTGVEALLRWEDPTHGTIAPEEFIALAEENGTIVSIGQWALERATAQLAAWNRGRVADDRLTVAVNLSPRQFASGHFLEGVREALAASALSPGELHLEITENLMMREHGSTEAILRALDELGVALAIDDFGTGYSSLGRMRRVPARFIKIDRSFVGDCPRDAGSVEIVRAIIAMAHSLKLAVIAEGVENADQLMLLESLGCDLAQGYYFSEAVDAARVPLLRERFAGGAQPRRMASALER